MREGDRTSERKMYSHKVNSNARLMFAQDLFSFIPLLPAAGCMSGSTIRQIRPTWDFGNTQRCNERKKRKKKKKNKVLIAY